MPFGNARERQQASIPRKAIRAVHEVCADTLAFSQRGARRTRFSSANHKTGQRREHEDPQPNGGVDRRGVERFVEKGEIRDSGL